MNTEKKKILLVDDEELNLKLFSRILRNKYELFLTQSPLEALKILAVTKMDAIITDIKMPEMSGLLLLKQSLQYSPEALRIVVTGDIENEELYLKQENGLFEKCLIKPFDFVELNKILEVFFQK